MIGWLSAGLVVGVCLGVLHFGGLWRTVQGLESGGGDVKHLLRSALLRFAVTGAGLWLLAMLNPLAVISAMVGILVARRIVRHRVMNLGGA